MNRQEIPRSYQNAVYRLNIYRMTSNEVYKVAEAAHQLPNLYRAAIMKENSISATTFARWIKAEKNTPIFLKSSISLAVQMLLEAVKPIENYLVVIPNIPSPPLSRQQPLFYTYHLLLGLGRSVHTTFCKELDYSLASYFSMKNKEFNNLSGVELREFMMILIRAFTELLTRR
ncbi:hypothetical protein [uncultured Chitinophaga sp.]|uniref:hypothetical protein n=1 Tax=uncultured Chitinophaga sp. TaxID=339340 RepID=UPI00261C87CC|nr:hypothetical protein [uncultured Chitinophaga sp.]